MTKRVLTALLLSFIPSGLLAAQIPPAGLTIPAEKLERVKTELAAFSSEVDKLKTELAGLEKVSDAQHRLDGGEGREHG